MSQSIEALTPFEQSLHLASELVKRWGNQSPPGRPSVRELMTIEGISLWDVMAVDLALYHIPDGLAHHARRRTMRQIFAPYLRPIKYAMRRPPVTNTSDCARWPSRSVALCIGFSTYLARDVLQPVANLLLKESGPTAIWLTDEQGPGDPGTPWRHSIHRHRSSETVRQAQAFAKKARQASAILTGDSAYRNLFVEDGRNLWPQNAEGFSQAFKVHSSYILPDTIAIARHILSVHRPAVVVSIDVADPRTRIYSLLARQLGIPTVQIQSGGFGREAVEWRFLLDDVVGVQGEYSRDVFLAHGIPREKLSSTGSPRYDGLDAASDREVGELRARFGIPQQNRLVVFASSYFLDIHGNNLAESGRLLREMKKAIFAAVAATPEISLLVKPHPLEDVSETRALATDRSRIVFVERSDDIRMLTRACDAFFSMGSSVTMDALILGKPTVCPAFPGWNFSNMFIRPGAVMAPTTEHEVLSAMRQIAADGGKSIVEQHARQRAEYLTAVVYGGGHGATRRMVDLLNELCRSSIPNERARAGSLA